MERADELNNSHKAMAIVEDNADVLCVRIMRELSLTFITPIDREDILRISQMQETSMDSLHSLSVRLHIFEFTCVRFPATRMASTICSMLELSRLMLEGLRRRRDCHKTRAFRALRDECDMLLSVGLAELMDEQQEFTSTRLMQILKWSQVYERLSMLLDNVIELAETIEEAVLKNV